MCGRINLTAAPHALAETFFLDQVPVVEPRYNISPGQDIGAVTPDPDSRGRLFRPLRWGLIPPGERSLQPGPRLINARSETVNTKRSFADSFAHRRCLVPVTGFYEWKKTPKGPRPYLFRRPDAGLFALAGLWSRWERPGGAIEDSCTILTTAANSLMRPIHHRMPVILPAGDWDFWLDLDPEKADLLLDRLRPAEPDSLVRHPVTPRVNRPDFDEPACLEPVAEDDGQLQLF